MIFVPAHFRLFHYVFFLVGTCSGVVCFVCHQYCCLFVFVYVVFSVDCVSECVLCVVVLLDCLMCAVCDCGMFVVFV